MSEIKTTETVQLMFLRENNMFYPGFNREQDIVDHLPAAVYRVTVADRGGVIRTALAKLKDKFTLPAKIYGKESEEIYNLITEDFRNHSRGTSAMMYGHKGAGKSVVAERVANHCIAAGMPTFYYEGKIDYEQLGAVIMATGPCCIIAEEFLKHNADFNKDGTDREIQQSQHPLLTLLSNQDLPKFCFIALDNSDKGLSEYLVNRPDRIRWMIKHEFDRVAAYDEMVKDEPIQDLLKRYLRVYFSSFKDDDGGFDVMKMVIEKARNVMTIEEFVAKMKHWNVPKASFPMIEVYLDDVWNNRRATAEETNAGVDLRIIKNDKAGFPVVLLKNVDSEFLDPDQNNMEIDFADLITAEWIIDATMNVKKDVILGFRDLEFAVSINTKSSKKPTHIIDGFPFVFEITAPASRKKEDKSKD